MRQSLARRGSGNRKTWQSGGDTAGNATRTVNYTTNNLNQYTGLANPLSFDVTGMTTYPQVKVNTVYADLQTKPSSSDKHFRRDVTGITGLNAVTVQNCDAYGNPVGAAENGKTYLPPSTETLSYDADGNLLTDGRWVYVWDAENRLVEMRTATTSGITSSTADSVRLAFSYDYIGRRIQKVVYAYYNQAVPTSGTHVKTEKFVWDGWHCVAKLNGSSSESYVWGLDLTGSYGGAGGVGGLIMVNELNAPSGTVEKTHFAAYDGGGNVMALVSPTGTETTARYEYDPFGREIRRSGTYAQTNAWRFSTKWTDTESGLSYYGYRFYDPERGRWLSRDPIGEEGGLNLYGFVGNDGVNRLDYLGLDFIAVGKQPVNNSLLNGAAESQPDGRFGHLVIAYWKLDCPLRKEDMRWRADGHEWFTWFAENKFNPEVVETIDLSPSKSRWKFTASVNQNHSAFGEGLTLSTIRFRTGERAQIEANKFSRLLPLVDGDRSEIKNLWEQIKSSAESYAFAEQEGFAGPQNFPYSVYGHPTAANFRISKRAGSLGSALMQQFIPPPAYVFSFPFNNSNTFVISTLNLHGIPTGDISSGEFPGNREPELPQLSHGHSVVYGSGIPAPASSSFSFSQPMFQNVNLVQE